MSDLRERVARAIADVEYPRLPARAEHYEMADAAIALVLEEAAKVAEFRIGCDEWSADTNSGYECASREIAFAIRALKEKNND